MPFGSPFADVEIPNVTLCDYMFGALGDADANRVALASATGDSSITYGQLVARIDAVAGALVDRGVRPGDVVGLVLPNSVEFAVALHGVLRAGAAASPVNVAAASSDIASQMADSAASILMTTAAFGSKCVEAAEAIALGMSRIVILDDPGIRSGSTHGYENMADLIAGGRTAPLPGIDAATHVAVIPYSSGTTGKPKGVMLTHRNLVANLAQIGLLAPVTREDVMLAVVPFAHSYGLTVELNHALRGRCQVIFLEHFDFEKFLSAIERYRCTQAIIAPTVAAALVGSPLVESYDLSSLDLVRSAAASLDEPTAVELARRIGCRVAQAYGLTELSPGSHVVPDDLGISSVGVAAPVGSCGWTVPNSFSRIIDVETGLEVEMPTEGLSEAGELCFKGPNVMAGYLRDPAATAATVDSEGLLHTGDLARVDAHGCIYIVDRIKELIKYKGYQVAPTELESLLLTHRDVADAAVVGAKDEMTGEEVPKAFVVKQADASPTAEELIDFVADRVASYKKIRRVEFIDSVPRSANGKILRRQLTQAGDH